MNTIGQGNVWDFPMRLDVLFGHVEIITTRRWDGDVLILGGYSIHYDGQGKEVRRTPDEETVRCYLPEGEEGKSLRRLIDTEVTK